MKKGFSLKSILTTVFSLLTVFGAFLPWVTIKALRFEQSLSGISGENGVADGIFFVIGGIILIVLAAMFIKKEDFSVGAKSAISIISILLTILAIVKIIDLNGVPLATVGIGLYLLVASTLVTTVLPWIPYNRMLGK